MKANDINHMPKQNHGKQPYDEHRNAYQERRHRAIDYHEIAK